MASDLRTVLSWTLPLGKLRAGNATPSTTSGEETPASQRSPRSRDSFSASRDLEVSELKFLSGASNCREPLQEPEPVLKAVGAKAVPVQSEAALPSVAEKLQGGIAWLFGAQTQGALSEVVEPSKVDLPFFVRRGVYAAAAKRQPHHVDDTTGFFSWLFGTESRGNEDEGSACVLQDVREIGVLGQGSFGCVFLVRRDDVGPSLALKVVSKSLLAERLLEHTAVNERMVLEACDNPFLIRLKASFDTSHHYFYLTEAALGGNLFTVYERFDFFGSETHARFYVACLLNGIEHLHGLGWAYRDLKIENVVLDSRGYGKLCDFGTAKLLSSVAATHTYTVCGTLEYMAPEIFYGTGYSFSIDWWALGIVMYELMLGETPFAGQDNSQVFVNLKKGIEKAHFPKGSSAWPDLVKGLCAREPSERLPMMTGGAMNVREHSWFSQGGFDWDGHMLHHMEAPHTPQVSSYDDLSNFSFEEQEVARYSFRDISFAAGLPAERLGRDGGGWGTCLF